MNDDVIEMANPAHVAIMRNGRNAIAKWKEKHWDSDQTLDLTGANLKNLDLSEVYIDKVKFAGANLFHGNLYESSFLKSNFSGADLSWADACFTDLSGCNFMNAKLRYANLLYANLSEANLSGADLSFASLTAATLREADLSDSYLYATEFYFTDVEKTNFAGAMMNLTLISACDLSQCLGLETVKHAGPSSIGSDTLLQSFWKSGDRFTTELEGFFIDSGVPKPLLSALPEILAGLETSLNRSVGK